MVASISSAKAVAQSEKRSRTPLQGLLGKVDPPFVAASKEAAPAVPAAPTALLLLWGASGRGG